MSGIWMSRPEQCCEGAAHKIVQGLSHRIDWARIRAERNQGARWPRVRSVCGPSNIQRNQYSARRAPKGPVPVRNEVAADVYLEPPPPAVVEAELGLGSTRREPAMELLEPGTTV